VRESESWVVCDTGRGLVDLRDGVVFKVDDAAGKFIFSIIMTQYFGEHIDVVVLANRLSFAYRKTNLNFAGVFIEQGLNAAVYGTAFDPYARHFEI